jgi:hypothetical protein
MASQRVENADDEIGLVTQNKHALWGCHISGHHCIVVEHLHIDPDGLLRDNVEEHAAFVAMIFSGSMIHWWG